MGLTSKEKSLAPTHLNRLKRDFFCKDQWYKPSFLYENQVIQNLYQKPLGILLDIKLNFEKHLKYIANEFN